MDVSVFCDGPGGCVSVLGVVGWMSVCFEGGRVDVRVFWGCPDGCVHVLRVVGGCPGGCVHVLGGCVSVVGVTGWVCRCFGVVRVGVSVFWGWSCGCVGVLGVVGHPQNT